jgi:hypothetical protein
VRCVRYFSPPFFFPRVQQARKEEFDKFTADMRAQLEKRKQELAREYSTSTTKGRTEAQAIGQARLQLHQVRG